VKRAHEGNKEQKAKSRLSFMPIPQLTQEQRRTSGSTPCSLESTRALLLLLQCLCVPQGLQPLERNGI
jgi:hypothetical protein